MLRKTVVLLLFVVLIVGAASLPARTPAQAQAVVDGCAKINAFPDGTMDFGISFCCNLAFKEGQVVTITAGPPHEYEGMLPVSFSGYAVPSITSPRYLIASRSYPGAMTETVIEDAEVYALDFELDPFDGQAAVTWTADCRDAPDELPPVLGCGIELTANAAVGTFLTDIVPSWAAQDDCHTQVTINAGQTAWVLGVDETGAFYKIVWACQYLWVPVEVMGPNPDAVWNNTPLPTTVVE
jgi:hypothetical protein